MGEATWCSNPSFKSNTWSRIDIVLWFTCSGFSCLWTYLTVGAGKKELRDPIDEHAKMHELGIAHGHGGNKEAYEMSGKLNHDHEKSWLYTLLKL